MSPASSHGPVVVGVDGSPSSKEALAWAGRWAKLSGTSLLAVTAWSFPTMYGWGGPAPLPEDFDPEAIARGSLEESVSQVLGEHPGIEVTTEVAEAHPAVLLTELSKTASLVVVGCRGHGASTGMLLGSVSEFVITHAHCPVVVVRDG